MMDWVITIGLMLCILVGGTMSAAQKPGFFRREIAEPLRSQQTMQVGLAWLFASIVPFWRAHPVVGLIALLLGLVTFFQGCFRIYQFGKEKARTDRLAHLAKSVVANDAKLDTSEPMLTGKAASKNRRRAARKAAAVASVSEHQ